MASDEEKAWSVVQQPGKGEGLIARFDLVPGDHIISEAPLAVKSLYWTTDRLILRTLSALSADQQAQYERLHNALQNDPDCPDARIGRWRTNAFRVGSNNDKQAVFALISKFNHSCSPNVARFWDDETGRMVIHAADYIKRGEELFLSYTPVMESGSARRARLKDIWKFDCTCQICTLPEAEQMASDERRLELYRLFRGMFELSLPAETKLTLSEKALDLVMQEKLHDELQTFSRRAFNLCVYTERWEEAKDWAAIAHEHMQICLGSAHPRVTEMKTFIKLPWLSKPANESSSFCLIA